MSVLRVLVVDDCQDCRESLGILLRHWGHETRLAGDGPSVLAATREFHPQAVLLDIGLPGKNGWELARLLRKEWGNDLLLVAVTGFGRESDLDCSRESGFDTHLTKPADPEEVQAILHKWATWCDSRAFTAGTKLANHP